MARYNDFRETVGQLRWHQDLVADLGELRTAVNDLITIVDETVTIVNAGTGDVEGDIPTAVGALRTKNE